MKWISIPMVLMACWQIAVGQRASVQDVAVQRDSVRRAGMSFERVLNTFLWNGSLLYREQFDGMKLELDQHLRSRLIRTEQSSIQDKYEGTLLFKSAMTDRWDLKATVSSHVLSDARAVDLARLGQHQILAGLEYSFDRSASASLLGGMEVNSQGYERDQGFSHSAVVSAPDLSFEEIEGSVTSSWSKSFLGRRKPEHRNAALLLARSFGPGTFDSLSVQYDRLRREFYVKASPSVQAAFQTDNNIYVREADVVDIINQLNYAVDRGSMVSLRGGLMNRTIQRSMYYERSPSTEIADPRIQESQLYGSLSLTQALSDWASTSISMNLSEREESHSTRILNNISRRSSVVGDLAIKLSADDSLRISGTGSILRYDTPDSLNTDDRDELFFTLGLQEVHRFSRSLTLIVSADILLDHLVYLHRFQSASNNWNRVIRLSPEVVYTPTPWFRSTVQAEVLANYTVYDFEEQIASIRSFSFRQASWYDSTVVRAGRWEFVVLGGVRFSERGILHWKEFQERPENFFVDKNFWPQVFFRPSHGLRLGIGFRYFSQDRFKYSGGERIVDLELQNSGPTALFQLFEEGQERVSIEGWRETQTVNGVSLASIPNLTMRVSFGL